MDRRAYFIVARELIADKRISVTARLLLGFLLDHRNKQTGQCNPKRKTLARELGVSMVTISRALAELREGNFIRSKQQQHTASYQIQAYQIDNPDSRSGLSNRSPLAYQIDNPDPPYPLYESIKGEHTRARAKRASAVPLPKKSIHTETLERYYALYGKES